MKKILWIVALGAVCYACGNNSGEKPSETTSSTTTASEETSEEASTSSASSNPDYQKGLKLIAGSDCLTCHKVDEKLIGPSYREVANKYVATDETITNLAHKIIKGVEGSEGIWGSVPMTPHEDLPEEDAKAMVKYILLLKNK